MHLKSTEDYTGQVVGELRVIEKTTKKSPSQGTLYICRCNCGLFIARGHKQLTVNLKMDNGACAKGHQPRRDSIYARTKERLYEKMGYKQYDNTPARQAPIQVTIADIDVYVVHKEGTPIAVYVDMEAARTTVARLGAGHMFTRLPVQTTKQPMSITQYTKLTTGRAEDRT